FGKSAHQWHKELSHLEDAHRLFNAKQVDEQLVELRRDIARLELDLRGIGGMTYSETEVESAIQHSNRTLVDTSKANSAFRQVVGKFLGHAIHEQRLLNQWHEIFTERFSEVAAYLALDQSQYTADQLFSDLCKFRELYQQTSLCKLGTVLSKPSKSLS
ncbi:hypothetical protein EG68_08681, partial [Paragonimus skrjabini miyazakii]